MEYYQVYESDSGGWVWLHSMHDPDELNENLEAARILANHGYKIELLPVLDSRFSDLREALLKDVHQNKNPDIRINNHKLGDIKTPLSASKSAINRAIYRAAIQKVQVAVINLIDKEYTIRDVKTGIVGAIQPGRNKSIQEVWIITKNQSLFIVTRQNVYDNKLYEILDQI